MANLMLARRRKNAGPQPTGDLIIDGVTVTYDRGTGPLETAVTDLSLHVPQGELTVVVGHNGAGKSSLLRAIAGSVRIESGHISIGDVELSQLRPSARARMIGVVSDHPEYNTAAELTIEEHLSLALTRGNRRLRPALSRGRRGEIRALAGQANLGLDQRLGAAIGTLSAGQRQAVALIMALATGPALLLLDEYTTNLDPWTAERLRAATRLLSRESGATVICVTHDIDEALSMGDRIVVISRGALAADFDLRKVSVTREVINRAAGYEHRAASADGPGDAAW